MIYWNQMGTHFFKFSCIFVTLNNNMPSHRTNCWFSPPTMHVLDFKNIWEENYKDLFLFWVNTRPTVSDDIYIKVKFLI